MRACRGPVQRRNSKAGRYDRLAGERGKKNSTRVLNRSSGVGDLATTEILPEFPLAAGESADHTSHCCLVLLPTEKHPAVGGWGKMPGAATLCQEPASHTEASTEIENSPRNKPSSALVPLAPLALTAKGASRVGTEGKRERLLGRGCCQH